mmetsp:Transcript_18035/g.23281  ORF Transcript_18035/g.23281 Transcript_18035/m.23281 type:complete len:84 (+) Transcript_18035:200-451(+)
MTNCGDVGSKVGVKIVADHSIDHQTTMAWYKQAAAKDTVIVNFWHYHCSTVHLKGDTHLLIVVAFLHTAEKGAWIPTFILGTK